MTARISPHRICVAVSLLMMLSFLSLQGTVAQEPLPGFEEVHTILAPYSADPDIHIDGTIAQGEYDSYGVWQTPDTDLSVMLMHNNDSLFVGIDGPAWGWIALGISSDFENGMGFIIVGAVNGTYIAEERFVAAVSADEGLGNNLVFSTDHAFTEKTIKDFAWKQQGNDVSAELRLSLDSSLWTLTSGVVYPTVIASNLTAGTSLPGSASGDLVHYLGGYLLRSEDNPSLIASQFNDTPSSVPAIVAMVLIGGGVLLIFVEFVIRRGGR